MKKVKQKKGYIKQEFYDLVRQEAISLKRHGFKKELARLDFETLDPGNSDYCIYGQMTGSCFSNRAKSLILKCAPLMVGGVVEAMYINGVPKNKMFILHKDQPGIHDRAYFSPIENYINLFSDDSEYLINFLKGETDELILKDENIVG